MFVDAVLATSVQRGLPLRRDRPACPPCPVPYSHRARLQLRLPLAAEQRRPLWPTPPPLITGSSYLRWV
jgi:hypothetical protein